MRLTKPNLKEKNYIMSTRQKALITGITGQDGSYLAELLLSKGYEVFGAVRRVAYLEDNAYTIRINHILDAIRLEYVDITCYASVFNLINKIKPDEVYHLASQSNVQCSFKDSFSTFQTNINGTHFIVESLRQVIPQAKLYFAASSEMFGKVTEIPQKETTRFYPRSPYAISKITGFEIVRNYREAYNCFLCNGILFNHESPRRGEDFVTMKIATAIARIKLGKQKKLVLGNLDVKRDWGYAKDYVNAMYLILQQDKPDDYVISTGKSYSVKEFVELTCNYAEIDIFWQGEGINTKGVDKNGNVIVEVSKEYYRPTEVNFLLGDSTKARQVLHWKETVDFKELVKIMFKAKLEEIT